MTTFNPRDWPRLPDWHDLHRSRRSPREINREARERCCMVLAFCLCFAARAPPPLMPGAPLLASHPTTWDEAALLFTASLRLYHWRGPVSIT